MFSLKSETDEGFPKKCTKGTGTEPDFDRSALFQIPLLMFSEIQYKKAYLKWILIV